MPSDNSKEDSAGESEDSPCPRRPPLLPPRTPSPCQDPHARSPSLHPPPTPRLPSRVRDRYVSSENSEEDSEDERESSPCPSRPPPPPRTALPHIHNQAELLSYYSPIAPHPHNRA
ncbi:hypothetical protein RhiTH_009917 [Rhizoctonia solani]